MAIGTKAPLESSRVRRFWNYRELEMKKLVIALTAVAAFSGSASAADLAARPYTKAPAVVAPVASWTGCYVGAGGGGAYTINDHNDTHTGVFGPAGRAAGPNLSTGSRGWFGTVGAGCDYQVDRWVFGVFGDYDFMDVKGDIQYDGQRAPLATGSQKQDWQWAVGGRVGYVIVPQLMTYLSGGYTQTHLKATDLSFFGAAAPFYNLPGATKGGWFIGAGDEYALSFLPGLFWKTEYRYSEFDRANVSVNFSNNIAPGIPSGYAMTEKLGEHSVRSELVYRFNWGGPVVAKY
jgi:outer membrane immunogenic protein